MPDHAPDEYADRSLLWNAVEKIEKAKNAQLAREIEIALPQELTREQGISLVREYVKAQYSQSLYNLKDAANMLNFLTTNNIMDMAGLDEKFSSMIGEQMDIRDKLKPIDRRLPVLKKHMEQADIYLKHKGKKALNESRANPQERLQHFAAGATGTTATQDTG